MLKFILSATLLIAANSCFANNEQQAGDSAVHSVRNFPVIVKNEMLENGVCRLYFDDGRSMKVACNKTDQPKPTTAGMASL